MINLSKKTKEKILCKAASIAKKSVSESNLWGWPPDCIGLFYQNQRPKSLRNEGNLKYAKKLNTSRDSCEKASQ